MSEDRCLEASIELNRYISSQLIPHLTSRNGLAPRIYAFAALARCNRLLSGMIELHQAGFQDISRMNLRPIVECWFLGTYLLLEPDEAYETLLALHKKQLGQMADNGWSNLTEVIEAIETESGTPNWKAIAARLEVLFAESSEAGLVTPMAVYNSIYRGESLLDIHGGIGVLQGHVDERDNATFTIERRTGPAYDTSHTKPAAALIGLFAIMVTSRIAFGQDELLRLHHQVLNCGAQT